jgi:hypothetical protein
VGKYRHDQRTQLSLPSSETPAVGREVAEGDRRFHVGLHRVNVDCLELVLRSTTTLRFMSVASPCDNNAVVIKREGSFVDSA